MAIESYKTKTNIYEIKKIYREGFISDIAKIGSDISTSKEVLSAILDKIPSHFSYNNIAKEIGKSSKTIETYLRVFQDVYSLVILNNIDIGSKGAKIGKNKKIHFLDPLFYYIFKEWSLNEVEITESLLAESSIVSHMAMLNFENFSIGEKIGYWSNSCEIDTIIRLKKLIGLEVRWKNKMDVSKYLRHKDNFKELYFLNKGTYNLEKNIFPLACFLVALDDKTKLEF